MRTYERTHPWITFELDLERAPPRLWLALGEARSKCEHLAGVPLKPSMAKHLHEIYLAKGVHATTAIEGNTLNERQILDRISGKEVVPESQKYLEQEVDNIVELANEIMFSVEKHGASKITPDIIKHFNEGVLKNLELEDHVIPGEYRKCIIGVLDYIAPEPANCEYLVDRLCGWLNSKPFNETNEDSIITGIIKSIVAHVYFVWIHPFGDGNGRTARLMEVKFLMEAAVPSVAIHLLSDHYNKTRSEYYRQLSLASKTKDLMGFLLYAVRGFVDQLREQLFAVRSQQWGVSWQNFIYEIYSGPKTVADNRQIELLLSLSMTDESVPRSQLRKLTPELAEMYAGKTSKTLTRDLNALENKGLIERTREGIRARKELILAFLPRFKKGEYEKHLERGKHMSKEEGELQLDLLSLLEKPSALFIDS